jgi:NADH dehydrogenase
MKKIDINDTITIFGGSGFLGTHLVKELANSGAKIKVVSRYPELNNELKVCGNVGQIALVTGDVNNLKDIETSVAGSTHVINLVGILYQKGKQRFNNLHIQAAKNIALACTKHKIKRLVHISALGIDRGVKAKYAITKLEGEQEVFRIFPDSVILRPSVIFGPEDRFINLFAKIAKFSPFMPLIGGGDTRFQPIYVGDVAKAIVQCLIKDSNEVCSKIFELAGPKIYSIKEIYRIIFHLNKIKRFMITIPYCVAKVEAFFLEFLPRPLLTMDQVELLKTDNILHNKNGLEELGIKPTPLETILPKYLK